MARIRIDESLTDAVVFEGAGVRLPRRSRRGGGGRRHQVRRIAGEVTREEVWMLREATFSVPRGQALAIVGHPGSGRDQLLRLAAGTLMPDEGTVVRGESIVPMIGMGGALERNYTVRQNIYLIGGLLGMLPEQVTERLPTIVETAGISKILDKYLSDASRAVRAKILWAIAMSADAPGYAVSGALIVGQPEFRRYCWSVVEEYKGKGTTFLVTSDRPSHLLRFCDRALLLDAGTIVADTTVEDALERLRQIPPPKDQVHFVLDDDDDDDDEDLL